MYYDNNNIQYAYRKAQRQCQVGQACTFIHILFININTYLHKYTA